MSNDLCNMDSIGLELSKQYDNYREYTDLLSQYIMSMITGWQVYITEKDVGIFNFNLVDTIFGTMSVISRIIYALVGISGLWGIKLLFDD